MSDKPYHHGNLRNSLIEAGIYLMNKNGESQFSLRKVAAECGVSYAAPYSHFKNKEELLLAMQEYVTSQLTDRLKRAATLSTSPFDEHMLVEMGKSYVLFFIEFPHYFRFLFSSPFMKINLSLIESNKDIFPPYDLFRTAAIKIMRHLNVPEERLLDHIISMWATVHGLAAIATMKNVIYSYRWEDKIEEIIRNEI